MVIWSTSTSTPPCKDHVTVLTYARKGFQTVFGILMKINTSFSVIGTRPEISRDCLKKTSPVFYFLQL